MNQELEQYLRFFMNYGQKDWLEWLASAEFAINNKVHLATKISPFMVNYGRELRIGADIRKKGKVKKGNRICGKNEEGARESKSSVEESTKGYEEVSE